jgi:hypothetical protein
MALPSAFFVLLFFTSTNISLNDPDVWWHLKTGDYILDHWDVPEVDPFAYTTPRPLTLDQKIGLRSQWLGQVAYHLAYRAGGGLLGVGIFRGLLIILPGVALFVWLRRRGMGPAAALAVVSLPALLLGIQMFYAFERPQGLSFSMVLGVIILLERARRKAAAPGLDWSYALLPAAMALWSNVHAGFIVGNMVLMIYAGAEALRQVYHAVRRGGGSGVRPVFFAVCALSVLASFLNPNSYHLFASYFGGLASMLMKDLSHTLTGEGGSWVREVVLEYKPLHYFYTELRYHWLVFYWVFTAVVYLSLFVKYWLRRTFDLAELLTVTLVVLFANMYARGIMFSLTVMPLYLGKTIVELRPAVRWKGVARVAVALLLALSVAFVTYSYRRSPHYYKPGVRDEWITPWYPALMSDFILRSGLAPPMYNYYTWGGFLIWSLYPRYQVFIDGRAIDNLVSRTADAILKLHPGWRPQMEAYDINFVAIPVVFRESGHIIPLAVALAYDDEWELVFIKDNGALFVRDVPKNRDIIRQYRRSKDYVFWEILKVANLFIGASPGNPVYHLSRADALFALGKVQEAREIYRRFPQELARREFTLSYLNLLRPLEEGPPPPIR